MEALRALATAPAEERLRLVTALTEAEAEFSFGAAAEVTAMHCDAAARLAELFAYGTLSEAGGIELSTQQWHKLQLLSLLSAVAGKASVSFEEVGAACQVSQQDEAEALVMAAVVRGILDCKMDVATGRISVHSARARDLRPADVGKAAEHLRDWLHTMRAVEGRVGHRHGKME